MNKEKFKKGLYISFIIFTGLALAITYFFVLYRGVAIGVVISKITLILRPFIIGAVIAYIMKSTCNAYEKLFFKWLSKRKKANLKKDERNANIIAVVATYITWSALISALLWMAIPQIIESISTFIQDLIQNMPLYIETVTLWIEDFKAEYTLVGPYIDQAGDLILGWLTTDLAPMLPEIGENIMIGVVDTFNVLKDLAIGLVISVFFLAGRKTFAKKTTLMINCLFKEKQSNAILSEARFADRMFGGFLEGKIIDSIIIGFIYFIAITLMDIRYAALLALICGVTNIIPFFGPFIGAVPSGLIILMSNDDPFRKLLYFVIFVCVIQFIDGNIIDPHIVGGNIKVSPFCVIFSVLLFGGLWGFGGLLVGVPTFAVIYDIIKKIIFHRMKKADKKEMLKAYLEDIGKYPKKDEKTEDEAKKEEPDNNAPTDTPNNSKQ